MVVCILFKVCREYGTKNIRAIPNPGTLPELLKLDDPRNVQYVVGGFSVSYLFYLQEIHSCHSPLRVIAKLLASLMARNQSVDTIETKRRISVRSEAHHLLKI